MTETQILIITEILGYLVLATALISTQVKKMYNMVILQCASNAFVVAQYLLRGEFSAMGICTLGAIVTLVIFFFDKKEKKFPIYLTVIFTALGLAVTVTTIFAKGSFDPFSDIIPILAWIVFNFAMSEQRAHVGRLLMMINSALWLVLNLVNFSTSLVITYSILMVTAIVGIFRLDLSAWRKTLKLKGKDE